MYRITRFRWLSRFLLLIISSLMIATSANAGELAKPRITPLTAIYVQQYMLVVFYLKNLNAVYSLGPVLWHLRIYKKQTHEQVFATDGEKVVDKSQEVEVTPEQKFKPSEPGTYTVVVEANSAVNITGPQKDSIEVEVLAPPDCPPPTRVPTGMLDRSFGNTIVYTAPPGCCYKITPFIDARVWYALSPNSTQTISDGQSVTFTLTPRDPNPAVSMVAFQWEECSKGKPSGKDYIVVKPPTRELYDTTITTPIKLSFNTLFGDPVSTATGQFVSDPPPDLAFASSPILKVARRYDGGFTDGGYPYGMGPNWQHNYNDMLFIQDNDAIALMSDGQRIGFQKSNIVWSPRSNRMKYTLAQQQSNWLLTDVTRQVQYTFNEHGRLIGVDDGHVPVTIAWENGNIASASDALGNRIIFTTNSAGSILSASDGERSVRYEYNEGGELTSFSNVEYTSTFFTYTSRHGQLASIGVLPSVHDLELTYTPNNKVASHRDAQGKQWTYAWGENTATVTDPDGVVETHQMNASGQVTSFGIVGNELSVVYDDNGLPKTIRNAEGGETHFTYHECGRPATITTIDGKTTIEYTPRTWNGTTVYDATKVTLPGGSTRQYQYNDRGLCTRYTDELGKQWNTTYDAYGHVLSATDPAMNIVSYTYTPTGNLASVTMPGGVTTMITTNNWGDVISTKYPDGSSSSITRDALGHPTKIVDELKRSISNLYDITGNLIRVTQPDGGVVDMTYNANSLLSKVKDPRGGTTIIVYTDASRLASVMDPLGGVTAFTYDDSGHPSRLTDRAGNSTDFEVNKDGLITRIQSPEGRSTTFEYDALGRRTSLSVSPGVTYSLEYDVRGNIKKTTDPGGRTTVFAYDAAGNRTSTDLGADVKASYQYKPNGDLLSVTDPEGGTWTWSYDDSGRFTGITDPAQRSVTYTYDMRGRVASSALSGTGDHCDIVYDAAGNITSLTYGDGLTVPYRYDAMNRVVGTLQDTCAFDVGGNMVYSNGMTMTYNANGWLTELRFSPSQAVQYMYDPMGRVASISDWNGGSMAFEHDADGLLTSIQRSNGVNTTIARDEVGRTTSVTEGSIASMTVSYGTGNRVERTTGTGYLQPQPAKGTQTYTYDDGNAHIEGAPDGAGRTTTVNGTNLVWNSASQVGSMSGATTATLTYDGFGRLVNYDMQAMPISVQWNDAFGEGFPAVVTTSRKMYAIPTPGGALAYIIDATTGEQMFPHYDVNGNVVIYTDAKGATIARCAYSPYGMVLATEGTPPAPFGFGGLGGVITLSTDLCVTPGRFYQPATGRFLSADPVRSTHPLRMNPYQYAYCDPVNWTDWSGRSPEPRPQTVAERFAESRRRLEEGNKRAQEEYEREIRKIEEQAARRRAEREEQERFRRELHERLEREDREWREQRDREHAAFDKARKKMDDLNKILFPPPPPRPSPTPQPGTTSGPKGGTALPGSGGTTPGGNGQTPSSGGTRTRGSGGSTGSTSGSGGGRGSSSGSASGSGGSSGVGTRPRGGTTGNGATPQPLGPQGTGRGSYNPEVVKGTSVARAFVDGFIEGLSPSEIIDFYFR
ncbi:MAG: hypothetical protein J5I53_07180 [Bradyrhizobiaceae bacterium]|nr:hypothetical protein [Bradyrhizobiaceae bacterium]